MLKNIKRYQLNGMSIFSMTNELNVEEFFMDNTTLHEGNELWQTTVFLLIESTGI